MTTYAKYDDRSAYVKHEDRADSKGNVLYGLDKELADKAKAKLSANPKMEAEARSWIEELLHENFGDRSFQEVLQDGSVLCRVINVIRPNTIPKVAKSTMPFKKMENIAAYLEACSTLGVPAYDLFQTVALYENKDMLAVLTNIHSLGRVAQRIGFTGPLLGAKLADANKREFTEEKLQAAKAVPTFAVSGAASGQQKNWNNFQNTQWDEKPSTGTFATSGTTAAKSTTIYGKPLDAPSSRSAVPSSPKPSLTHVQYQRSRRNLDGLSGGNRASRDREIEGFRAKLLQQTHESKVAVQALEAQVRELKEQNEALARENSFLKPQGDQQWGATSPKVEALREISAAAKRSTITGSKAVEYHQKKKNSFTLTSQHVPHGSMGAAAVLDGAPVKEDHDDAALFIIDPQNDFHEGGSLGVDGAWHSKVAGIDYLR